MTHREVLEYWTGQNPFFDIATRQCFACRTDRPLEMAHIIAASLGGPATPDNLVLLCSRCHREAPMLNQREYMLEWIKNRESEVSWRIRRVIEELGGAVQFQRIAVNLAGRIDQNTLDLTSRQLGIDVHSGGDMAASIAGVIKYLDNGATGESIPSPS